MIPAGITRDHVLAALHAILTDGVPPNKLSTGYCLVHGGRHFPPKHVISLAHKAMTGFELPSEQFNGGFETNSRLARLGFQTVPCKCGGLKAAASKPALASSASVTHHSTPATASAVPKKAPALHPETPYPVQEGRAFTLTERVHLLLLRLPRWTFRVPSPNLPQNGVYVFFERGETAHIDGYLVDRIVRVGTHNEDGNFRQRIKQHFGHSNSLSGNKNGSVFRMHVGGALMARDNPDDPRIKPWCTHMGTSYQAVEELVSQTLRGNFTFACFPVETRSERLSLEEGLIALLAQHPIAQPSPIWLGRHAVNELIRTSGLWNTQKVNGVPLSSTQFTRIEQLVGAN